jgi:3-deoxy-manno-octulosonate cytidylyltransferase (CMP-KDO synthetase)
MIVDPTEFLIVLPARYASTRLPGKALADICGKPMIVRSFENARSQAPGATVVVATDDEVIADVCHGAGAPVVMTDKKHPTGTDRVAEAARLFRRPYVINYQPDEPLLEDGVIARVMQATVEQDTFVCGMSKIANPADICNESVGKVVFDVHGYCIYISRHPIPFRSPYPYWTQTCVYGCSYGDLQRFSRIGQTDLELSEGIELLRWLDMGLALYMVVVPGERLAVDTPGDLDRVRAEFLRRHS